MSNNIANPASDEAPKTILLRGTNVPHSELPAAAAGLIPGKFVTRNSSDKFELYTGTQRPAGIVREPSMIGGSVDTVYAADDNVHVWHPRSGDWVWAWIEEEANVAIGAILEMNGAGVLQAFTSGAQIARALEAKNVTAISGPVRIKVEIL